jgi:hypothetical protein
MLLQLGRRGSVEIVSNVGDAEQVLSQPALPPKQAIRHETGFRLAGLGNNNLLAGSGLVDQFGEVVFAL